MTDIDREAIDYMFKRIDFWSTMRYLSGIRWGLYTNNTAKYIRWMRISDYCTKRYFNARYDLEFYIDNS